MTKVLSILFLLLVCGGMSAHAQKYMVAQVTFHDGSSRQGMIKHFAPDDRKIKFKASEEAKIEKLKAKDIRMILIPATNGEVVTVESMRVEGRMKNLLVRKVMEGPVSLYHMQMYQANLGVMDHYMVKRPDEEKCTTIIALTIGARRVAKKYFKDCPALVEKIESGELTEYPDMVAFYNKTIKDSGR